MTCSTPSSKTSRSVSNASALTRFVSPGDVKDYVKKVKLEDVKIENRRKQLAKAAERMAAARAKAAAASTASPAPGATSSQDHAPSPGPAHTGPKPATPSAPPATPPLHPSLPAKPGTTPSKPPPPATPEPVPAPIVAPIPTPAPIPVPVVEVVPPPDDLILQYEEVKLSTLHHRINFDLQLMLRRSRTNNDGRGSHFGPREISIYSTLGR